MTYEEMCARAERVKRAAESRIRLTFQQRYGSFMKCPSCGMNMRSKPRCRRCLVACDRVGYTRKP